MEQAGAVVTVCPWKLALHESCLLFVNDAGMLMRLWQRVVCSLLTKVWNEVVVETGGC